MSKQPIYLTGHKFEKNGTEIREATTVIHPNEIEAFGTLKEMGKQGLRVLVKYKGETWHLKRANNTEYFKQYDKNKGRARVWYCHKEGERWTDSSTEAHVILWECAWKTAA